jgi:hypothetical protein
MVGTSVLSPQVIGVTKEKRYRAASKNKAWYRAKKSLKHNMDQRSTEGTEICATDKRRTETMASREAYGPDSPASVDVHAAIRTLDMGF